MSEQPEDPEDVCGTWTITLEGGPATAANLAVTLRSMSQRSWTGRVPSMCAFVERLASALDAAEFTPEREPQNGDREAPVIAADFGE